LVRYFAMSFWLPSGPPPPLWTVPVKASVVVARDRFPYRGIPLGVDEGAHVTFLPPFAAAGLAFTEYARRGSARAGVHRLAGTLGRDRVRAPGLGEPSAQWQDAAGAGI
jgi:hypothetical protein